MNEKASQKTIVQVFQKGLLVCVIIALIVSIIFTYVLQTRISRNSIYSVLSQNIWDVYEEVMDFSDEYLLLLAQLCAYDIDEQRAKGEAVTTEYLQSLAEMAEVYAVHVVDENGIITASSSQPELGYDMHSGEQSRAFLVLLEGEESYVQPYQPISIDSSISRKYGGYALQSGGFVQVAWDWAFRDRNLEALLEDLTNYIRVGEDGCIVLADSAGAVLSTRRDYVKESVSADGGVQQEKGSLQEIGLSMDMHTLPQMEVFIAEIYGQPSYCMHMTTEGYSVLAALPRMSMDAARRSAIASTIIMEVVVFVVLFALVNFLIKRQIVENVHKINQSLAEITQGNLEVVVDVRNNREFALLSEDINNTVDTLKRLIDEAGERVAQELEFARTIQHAALPTSFPNCWEVSLFALMEPAKEVGGDFYDFYSLPGNRLGLLIADVSDKGIPAAMFMMQAKMLIKGLAENGLEPAEIFEEANNQLCVGNDTGMFITAWMGILELSTGHLVCVNAGHNPPLLRHKGGFFENLPLKAGFILAGLENIPYTQEEIQLMPGDQLYLYTDGVTDALNEQEEMFGEERLKEALNTVMGSSPEVLCRRIRQNVGDFAGKAAQFDDITMMCLSYTGEKSFHELNIPAEVERLDEVLQFVEEQLTLHRCPLAVQVPLLIAVEEIYVNIAHYAYAPEKGEAIIQMEMSENPYGMELVFIDSGRAYNPLEKKDPDITLPAEEREIGGLGIFMVKDTMDEVAYERKNDRNILTLKKSWEADDSEIEVV